MFVPVVAVAGVQMAVVEIVDVIAVGNRRVSTARAVLVIVVRVFDAVGVVALVPMVVVLMVAMTVVDVVDVIPVRHGHVTAVGSVDVRVILVTMIVVNFCFAHEHSLASP